MLIGVAALGFAGCVDYSRPAYAGGYYSAGYGYPYGYGYGDPYYGYPYYGGPSVVISGVRYGGYHGYRSPYYRDRYYPRAQVQSSMTVKRGGTSSRPRVRGSKTRAFDPRTQPVNPQ